MIKALRRSLLDIENRLMDMVEKGADYDYPEIVDTIQSLHEIRVNSKIASTMAFDKIESSNQFLLATDNGENIKVWGHSGDEFDLELAFGIINRAAKTYDKERLYCLFLKVMDGDFNG